MKLSKIFCFFGFHKKEVIDKERGWHVGGIKCSVCDKVIYKPLKIPTPKSRPLTEGSMRGVTKPLPPTSRPSGPPPPPIAPKKRTLKEDMF